MAHGLGAGNVYDRHANQIRGEGKGEYGYNYSRKRPCKPALIEWHALRLQTKCAQYWPEEGTEIYGDIEVALIDWVDLAHYSIMTLQICKVGTFLRFTFIFLRLRLLHSRSVSKARNQVTLG